jgi:outer membrane protein assembly factor BamB
MRLACAVAAVALACGAASVAPARAQGGQDDPMRIDRPPQSPPKAAPVPTWNGTVLWSVPLASAPSVPPAINRTLMFAPLRDGTIVAVNHLSGQLAWSVKRAATVAPLALDGLVIGADGAQVWALDAATGAEAWTRSVDAAVMLPLSSGASRVAVATERQELVVLDADTGQVVSRSTIGGRMTAPPVFLDGVVFGGVEDGRVVAIDAATGRALWTRTLNGRVLSLTAFPDRVFAGGTDDFFYSLDPRNGAVQWKWRVGGDVAGTAVADARRVYIVSMDNMLRALDRRHGDLRWQRPLMGRPVGGPLFLGGFLVLAQVAPELRCFDVATGAPACVVGLPGRPLHRPFLPTEGTTDMPRLVFLSGGGQAVAVGPSPEPSLVKWKTVPGKELPAEVAPPNPLPVKGKGSWPEAELVPWSTVPGRRLPPEVLPPIRRPQ